MRVHIRQGGCLLFLLIVFAVVVDYFSFSRSLPLQDSHSHSFVSPTST